MLDRRPHWPDPQILKQAGVFHCYKLSSNWLNPELGDDKGPFTKNAEKLSSVCVDFKEEEGYMTRTTTIILVDQHNIVKFLEQNHDKNKTKTVLDFMIN